MVFCPKCNLGISYLIIREESVYEARFCLSEGQCYETDGHRENKTFLHCPICLQPLFNIIDQGEAETFLTENK